MRQFDGTGPSEPLRSCIAGHSKAACAGLTMPHLLFAALTLGVDRAERLRSQAICEDAALGLHAEPGAGAAYGVVTAQQIAEAERLMTEQNSDDLRGNIKRGTRKGSGSYGFE